jgi:hypothetical protein
MSESVYTFDSLRGIRNNALLLIMANKYLNEEVFLKKIGKDIEKHIPKLKKDIASLKKEFPGKFQSEIDTDSVVDKFTGISKSLLNLEKGIIDKCADGVLGRELENNLKAVEKAINEIKIQVYGSEISYTKKDSMDSVFRGLGGIGSSIGKILLVGLKIIGCLVIICIMGFLYLFFTMEKESPLLKKIEQNQTLINEQNELLSEIEKRRNELAEEIKGLEKKTMIRENKIALLDLDVEIQKLNQDQHNIEARIESYKSSIKEMKDKITEISKKPFIDRLLRQ